MSLGVCDRVRVLMSLGLRRRKERRKLVLVIRVRTSLPLAGLVNVTISESTWN